MCTPMHLRRQECRSATNRFRSICLYCSKGELLVSLVEQHEYIRIHGVCNTQEKMHGPRTCPTRLTHERQPPLATLPWAT